jgi:hypothetical protein
MPVIEVIAFENNQAAMSHLQEYYAERRKIDKELGNKSTVRYLVPMLTGTNANMSIVYEYENLAQLEEEWNRRNANERWTKLTNDLVAKGFQPVSRGALFEVTPK